MNQVFENNDLFTLEHPKETSNINSHIAHLEAAHKNCGTYYVLCNLFSL